MNINFSDFFKKSTSFLVLISVSYGITFVMYLVLPKMSVENEVTKDNSLEYTRYEFIDFFNNKITKTNESKNEKSKKSKKRSLKGVTLKAVYNISSEVAWIAISDKNKKTHVLSIGEKYQEYKLIKAYDDYVVFEKNDNEYKIELPTTSLKYTLEDKSETSQKYNIKDKIIITDDKVSVSKKYFNTYIKDISKIWKEISIKEIKNNNNIRFKIYNIKRGSVFDKLGLKNGDILKSVNNVELKSYNDAFNFFKKIDTINFLNIIVIRLKEEIELNYEII